MIDTWAKHPDLHTSPEIGWSRCDGCDRLTVKPRDWARHVKYGYYCDALFKELTREDIYKMAEKDCPIGRKLRRGKR